MNLLNGGKNLILQILFGRGLLLMGAPKQKWTAEEEAALKAGVLKHGTGKWRTILMDPEFSATLRLRSNVDLKVYICDQTIKAKPLIYFLSYY